jgi:FlaA1/EpsC-like NDP-sugar epimerase
MKPAVRSLLSKLRRVKLRRVVPSAAPREALQPAAAAPVIEIAPPRPVDLLGRPVVNLDTPELQRFLAGKRVMVTGAGGSIGSEICRQAMRFCPQKMLLVERAENALFEIDRELREAWVGAEIRPYLADICDQKRIEQIFRDEQPHVVFHCAAHKHVPMMEANAAEAVKNNVFGTRTVADAAAAFGAQAFVLVSTDKAVNPTSVMGATKRVAEIYVQAMSAGQRHEGAEARRHEVHSMSSEASFVPSCLRASVPSSTTRFTAVRFGNVLGSSGSVVPIFQRQIKAGGPVTVTHPEMRRYFMTIPEASQLVMQAGAIGKGGEVFVLDMGSPVRILDLAREMIRRSGLVIDRDIQVRFSGIRPGEKLYEELARDDERTAPTSHEKIRVWQLPAAAREEVERLLDLLSKSLATTEQVIAALSACVPEYQPTDRAAARATHVTGLPTLRLVIPDAEPSAIEAA